MKLSPEDRDLLHRTRIAMLALNAAGAPSVSAGAYYHQGDSVWMTTSRFAQKIGLIRRNPRASMLVTGTGRSLLLQGVMEVFDLRSLSGQVRAALNGPGFYSSMAGYAIKNLPFIGGYFLEIDRVPGQWWPQNRLVLRLKILRVRRFETSLEPTADPSQLAFLPREVTRRLARVSVAHACWRGRGGLNLEPCGWVTGDRGPLVAFAERPQALEEEPVPAAVVVEKHHPYRPTLMVGAYYRGELVADAAAARQVAARYALAPAQLPCGYRLETTRVTTWKGFEVQSHRIR